MCFVCLKARGKVLVPKKKRPRAGERRRGPFFSKNKGKKSIKNSQKTELLTHSLTHSSASFPAAGWCASLFFFIKREKTYVIHTHTHTHTHALKTRKESLSKTIVIRKEDVSREEE